MLCKTLITAVKDLASADLQLKESGLVFLEMVHSSIPVYEHDVHMTALCDVAGDCNPERPWNSPNLMGHEGVGQQGECRHSCTCGWGGDTKLLVWSVLEK